MKSIPIPIIAAAQDYDPEAIDFIFRHFEGYINKKAVGIFTNEYGGIRFFADDDLRYQAELALFDAIAGFRFKNPPENFQA